MDDSNEKIEEINEEAEASPESGGAAEGDGEVSHTEEDKPSGSADIDELNALIAEIESEKDTVPEPIIKSSGTDKKGGGVMEWISDHLRYILIALAAVVVVIAIVLIVGAAVKSAGDKGTATSSGSSGVTAEATKEPEGTKEVTPTATATPTAAPTEEPTPTPEPTEEPTPEPTEEPEPEPAEEPEPEPTEEPEPEPEPTEEPESESSLPIAPDNIQNIIRTYFTAIANKDIHTFLTVCDDVGKQLLSDMSNDLTPVAYNVRQVYSHEVNTPSWSAATYVVLADLDETEPSGEVHHTYEYLYMWTFEGTLYVGSEERQEDMASVIASVAAMPEFSAITAAIDAENA